MRPCDVDRSAEPWRYTVPPRWNKTFHKGRARVVMLGPKARAILAPWLDAARAPDAAVFRSPIGRSYYTRDALWLAIRRAAVRAGVPPFGPGRLRHSAGSRIRAVADLETARAVLGHSDAATTLVYAEADQSKAAKIAEEMG
jgi:integrase